MGMAILVTKILEDENINRNKEWQKFIGYPVKEKVSKIYYQKKIRKNNRLLKCNYDYRENKS